MSTHSKYTPDSEAENEAKPLAPNKLIFVVVAGGVAEVCEDTIPQGCAVEIIDFDNIRQGDSYPSAEAEEYARAKGWL